MSTDREPDRINLSWLVRLRWGAIAGQLCTIAGVRAFMDIQLPLGPLLALIVFEAAINVGCWLWLRSRRPAGNGLLAAVMALDVVALTGLLFFSGGSMNPFSFLYLVNIALAAVVLPTSWTWALLGLAALSSGLLFSGRFSGRASAEEAMSHAQHMQMHLQGMWIAFVVAAVFIVYFVSRVRRALAARERDLELQREAAARHERLSALGTLAAGAAHELATPLGTIAMVSRELERSLRARPGNEDALADVGLVREQVERCRGILDQMSVDAGSPRADAPRAVAVGALMEAALEQLPGREAVALELDPAIAATTVTASVRALAQALRGIVKNGMEASASRQLSGAGAGTGPTPVWISGRVERETLELSVRDQGKGMPDEVLARAGEPFFTTKQPGQGMGLGLFLARTVTERLGGTLLIESQAGAGTHVRIRLPIAR